jgi:uncharacterized membrane protein (DUF373 family)
MTRTLKLFEKIVIYILICLLALVILLSTLQLGWQLVQQVIQSSNHLPAMSSLLDIFGDFLLILIGLELLETIKAYLSEHVVHVEIVLEVALIAVARKVVVLDVKEYKPETLLGIAAILLALALGYYLERRARRLAAQTQPE